MKLRLGNVSAVLWNASLGPALRRDAWRRSVFAVLLAGCSHSWAQPGEDDAAGGVRYLQPAPEARDESAELPADLPDPAQLIADAVDRERGTASYAEMEMQIHRPDWQRTSSIVAWTRGREDALIRFTAPARDAGNATLKQGEQMWTFAPRVNRVVRLPSSMMSQSWAGSDFSYNDLSRTDSILLHYDHRIVDVRVESGHRIYIIESTPHAEAPIRWGMQRLVLRDDSVRLAETFYDQDGIALKHMEVLEVGELGGRVIGIRSRMTKLDEEGHWTEVNYLRADFDIEVADSRFTQHALRNSGS